MRTHDNSFPNQKGFTLVELLVVVAILGILSFVAYVGIQRAQVRSLNEKVTSDLLAIENALNQYKLDNGSYPTIGNALSLGADKNVLCFSERHTYLHNCEEAAFVQTQVDNQLLTKRYLQEIPTDPRTGSRYAYGVTRDGKFFQLAGDHQNNDDSWQAEVVDNLDEGSVLPSLIRSFDGPDFVYDAKPHLPYSPDATQVTGRLFALVGAVTIDGLSAQEGAVVEAGSTVKTELGGAVVIYFSDGSITYLDSATELRLLPNSEVAQNDADGIITKVRLKLFQGKIWNKVVRLAEKSEFNVETTTAIAGVRGTEFGLDAEIGKVIVYSGQMALRQKTQEELNESQGVDQYLEFNALEDFLPGQVTESKELQMNAFTFPPAQNGVVEGTPVSSNEVQQLLEKYYPEVLGLSLADLPYIVKAQSTVQGTYQIYVNFNGFSPNDLVKLDGFEIFDQSQTEGVRQMKDGALENPLLTVTDFVVDDEAGAYRFEVDFKTQPDNPLYNEYEGVIEPLVLRGFQVDQDQYTYSQVSWPPIGLPPNPTEVFVHEFNNADIYQELAVIEAAQQGTIKITQKPAAVMNLDMNEPVPIVANEPCVWSITPAGSGVFTTPHENVDTVAYLPLDPKLKGGALADNIVSRFQQSQQPVSVTCIDPIDQKNFETIQFKVAYKIKSQTASYQYGYLAKNNVSWNQAHDLCSASTEGGFTDWGLPTKTVYENLKNQNLELINLEKQNLCELNGENNCLDFDLSKALVLHEAQNDTNGEFFNIFNNGFSGFAKSTPYPANVFRCVRGN